MACGAPPPPPPPPPSLDLVTHEYGYQMPASIPAGLMRVTLRNEGHDVHEGVIVRFTDPRGNAAAYVDSVRAGVDLPAFARNDGTEAREGDIFRLSDTTQVSDYLAWLKGGEVGTPPVDPVGGLGDL